MSRPYLKYGCDVLSSSKRPSLIWMSVRREKLLSTSDSFKYPPATAFAMFGVYWPPQSMSVPAMIPSAAACWQSFAYPCPRGSLLQMSAIAPQSDVTYPGNFHAVRSVSFRRNVFPHDGTPLTAL